MCIRDSYYPINEGAARRAKEMNSFSDYKEGSATAEYRAMVDKAAAIAEQQKSRVEDVYKRQHGNFPDRSDRTAKSAVLILVKYLLVIG